MNCLAVHMAGLGDLVVALPFLSSLDIHCRPGRLVFAADERDCEIVEMAGIPCQKVLLTERPWRALWDSAAEDPKADLAGFDLAVETWSLGQREKRWRELLGCQVRWLPPDPGTWTDGCMAERAWAWGVNYLGFTSPYRDPQLEPGGQRRLDVAAYLKGRSINPPYAVVCPGSGTLYKNWPEDNFWKLCRRIRSELGVQLVVALGPTETGRGMVAPPDACDYCCKDWGLVDIAALVGSAAFYVGNDSGVSHVAVWTAPAAGGHVPCILTFCRLNVRNWAVCRDWVDVIPLPCATPYDVTVDQVFAKCRDRFTG